MKLGLKWALPGDISGGLMIFGIMFTIAVIEMYVLKAFQGTGGVTATSLTGGKGGAPPKATESSQGGQGGGCKKDRKGHCIETQARV